ncbi:uncharacterized protein LOC134248685 [Saccostrea cucullata]|uniref:uncharacterized protein LOC134248685 n=1 Tax=Saccostrea cuccullata TaxID=36930 RepID=UPI002ED1662B
MSNGMDYILLILISLLLEAIFILSNCSTIPVCERGFKSCCPDYSWDVESQACKKCLPGYAGINCTKCPFPYYGEKCQEHCQCSVELCHFSQGCPIPSTEMEDLSTVTSTVMENDTIWTTETSSYMYTNSTSRVSTNEPSSINRILLIFIKVIGFADVLMILTNVAVCIYDRQYKAYSRDLRDTTVNFPDNDTMYENVQIIFPPV